MSVPSRLKRESLSAQREGSPVSAAGAIDGSLPTHTETIIEARDHATAPAMPLGVVVYAREPGRLIDFYAGVAGLPVTHRDDSYAILRCGLGELVVHRIAPHIAASIVIANPPIRREDTAVKLVFQVASIGAARAAVAALGGELNPVEREWRFGQYKVCDGHDPEGNVFQLREAAP